MVRVIRTKDPLSGKPDYKTAAEKTRILPFKSKPLPDTSVKIGNDMSYGDAKEERRTDKDDDLKKGDDNESPLAKPDNRFSAIRGKLIRLIKGKK